MPALRPPGAFMSSGYSCSKLPTDAHITGSARRSGVVAEQGLPDTTGAPQSVHPAIHGALPEMTEPGPNGAPG